MSVPKPWYRNSKDAWYVRLNGKLHRLAKGKDNEAQAHKAWQTLMRQQGIALPLPTASVTLSEIATAYLERPEAQAIAPNSRRTARIYLLSFAKANGHVPASEIRKAHLQAWIDAHEAWSDDTAWTACRIVIACLNWAVKEELFSAHRLKGFCRPQQVSRGSECLVSEATHQRLVDESQSEALRVALTMLKEVGCRPGELCQVTAEDFDASQGLWRIRQHKTKRKGKQRFILLTPKAIAICKEQAEAHPTGAMFRTVLGNAWTSEQLFQSLRNLCKRLGITDKVSPYSYRHTFATSHLANGAPEAHIAALLGHANTKMIHKHYGHLDARLDALRQTLTKGNP
ncbi:MAG: site-specific integrase [Planctomycetia bacterium]|nr:site-specific integrase [Planctomycetia bacterium]